MKIIGKICICIPKSMGALSRKKLFLLSSKQNFIPGKPHLMDNSSKKQLIPKQFISIVISNVCKFIFNFKKIFYSTIFWKGWDARGIALVCNAAALPIAVIYDMIRILNESLTPLIFLASLFLKTFSFSDIHFRTFSETPTIRLHSGPINSGFISRTVWIALRLEWCLDLSNRI